MKVGKIVLLASMLSVFSTAHAATWYVGGSIGSANISGISTAKEDSYSSPYYTTATTVEGKSHPYEVFAGWTTPWWDTAIEVSAMRGLSVAKHTTVTLSYQGAGIPPLSFDQRATATALGISVLKYVKTPWAIDPFVRVGVARYKGELTDSIPFGSGYSLNYQQEKSKTAPFVGLGAEYRGKGNWFARVEGEYMAKGAPLILLSVGYRF
ncbi:MAG: outer membrane beta-barrel protein [Candidatus Paceibacteria bacterium]